MSLKLRLYSQLSQPEALADKTMSANPCDSGLILVAVLFDIRWMELTAGEIIFTVLVSSSVVLYVEFFNDKNKLPFIYENVVCYNRDDDVIEREREK